MGESLQGQVAIVTGANGGLGTEVTKALLGAGATVAGIARSMAAGEAHDNCFYPVSANLTDPEEVRERMARLAEHFGKIDLLVHVMGGFAGGASVAETDDATWRKMMDLNLNAAFYVLRAVVPVMRRAEHGRIIAIGSRQAVQPMANVGAYAASKAALVSLGELDLWQIAMKPGKPLAFGHAQGVPFIGLPGNPVSSFVTFVLFVRPFLLRCLGASTIEPHRYSLAAGFDRKGDGNRREFLRVRRNADGVLEPYPNQGAALLSSVTWADGLVELAADGAIERGRMVEFLSLGELTGPA